MIGSFRVLKPAEGRMVIDPSSGRALDETGRRFLIDQFWMRRILAGDVLVVEESAAPATMKATRRKKHEEG